MSAFDPSELLPNMTRRDFVRRLSLLSDYANSKLLPAALALAMLGIASGCATTGTQPEDSDPLESANRTVYGFNDALDDYVLEPIADNYVKYVPQPMRTGAATSSTMSPEKTPG